METGSPCSGLELPERLHRLGRDLPVIFLTARDSAEDRVSGFTKGGDDYVTKPFWTEEVLADLQALAPKK